LLPASPRLLDLYEASADTAAAAAPATAPTARARTYNVDSSELRLVPVRLSSTSTAWKRARAWSARGRPPARKVPVSRRARRSYAQRPELRPNSKGTTRQVRSRRALPASMAGYCDNPQDEELIVTITSVGFFALAEELRPEWDPVKHENWIERIPHELSTSEKCTHLFLLRRTPRQ
jgi:hypothetical protein